MSHDLDHDLRALDPTSRQTNGLSDRALDDLRHIMSTPPGDPTDREYAGGRAIRRPRRSRWVTRALPAAAAAVGLAVLAPNLFSDDSAFATWTARPAAPSVEDVAEAGRVCGDFWRTAGVDRPLPGLTVALAEERGDWTYTVMRTSDGQFADCLMQLEHGRWWSSREPLVTGGGGLTPPLAEGPTAGELEAVMYSGSGSGTDEVGVVAISGRVGPQVVSVVAHDLTVGDVRATVADGYWAAWWPTPVAPGTAPDLDGLTLTVTVADGSTYEVTHEEILEDVMGP